MSCQSCQTLSSTASHSKKEGVAQGLADDTRDTTDMADSVQEQDEPHLGRVHLVVIFKVLF